MEYKMIQGSVKWFNETKGFGFLNASGRDYFIHFSEIMGTGFKTLNPGDKVQFEPSESPKGPTAKNVCKLTD